MWGTAQGAYHRLRAIRFIPTHVGNGGQVTVWVCKTPVHPHACGERLDAHRPPPCNAGSSPRMWGTVTNFHDALNSQRFIPTHVGNGKRKSYFLRKVAVHPHACGERAGHRSLGGDAPGSSPRMWGTGLSSLSRAGGRRFIPTHVGNGIEYNPQQKVRTVHPHACGERTINKYPRRSWDGSSPRMWGTVNNEDVDP